jgi:hypothetical protein
MPAIRVDLREDDQAVGRDVHVNELPTIHTIEDWVLHPLIGGMQSGRTSVMLFIPAKVNDVDVLVAAETSLQMWVSAATILAAKFPDEVTKPGWANLSPQARAVLGPRFAEAVRRATGCDASKAIEASNMIMDGFAADGPPIEWTD